MAREAMDICLRLLKKSKKSRFDSYSVRNSVLIISHITFRDCRVHFFSDNLSRSSCIQNARMLLITAVPVSDLEITDGGGGWGGGLPPGPSPGSATVTGLGQGNASLYNWFKCYRPKAAGIFCKTPNPECRTSNDS